VRLRQRAAALLDKRPQPANDPLGGESPAIEPAAQTEGGSHPAADPPPILVPVESSKPAVDKAAPPAPKRGWRLLRLAARTLIAAVVLSVASTALFFNREARTSHLQADYLTELGQELDFRVGPGASDSIRFPSHGPYDQRLGYADMPEYLRRLGDRGYAIVEQARASPRLLQLQDFGLFPAYAEKAQAGLSILDCTGEPIFRVRYPERVYRGFASLPPVLVDTLLYIENRELLDARFPHKNPAVEWDRFGKALVDQVIHKVDPEHETPGGSTLATQIEKYRHSPEGRTVSAREKLRQMASASVRAYLGGADTTQVRRRLVVDYLNSVPLAAKPGFGEVNGMGDGLWAWYGRNLEEISTLLGDATQPIEARALAYKQALSLMISQRRPSYYLSGNDEDLEELTTSHLRLLANVGVITPELRDAALAQPLKLGQTITPATPGSFAARKTATTVRTHLASLLRTPRLYDLDRLDLTARTTLDTNLQQAATTVLRDLRHQDHAKAAGLLEERLLAKSDPAKVIYSFTLFERSEDANLVRVQTDNFDQPFDINEGTKLDLGSTAKLRTLVTYLEIVAKLHGRYSTMEAAELKAEPVAKLDAITRWAIDYLMTTKDKELKTMLDAAMERRYSAGTGEQFFTGGGLHTFQNYDNSDSGRIMTVREATRRSVNLVYIRMMRDIVRHMMFNMAGSSATLLEDPEDPRRQEYLVRFADREGRVFLQRFYRKYQGKTPEQSETILVQGIRPTPIRLATIFRSTQPYGNLEQFATFLDRHLPRTELPQETIAKLFEAYSPAHYDLHDRGYLAGVHPLELWLVAYLRENQGASLAQAVEASEEQRQEVYSWLFKTRHKGAQDSRIRTLVEQEAFLEVHRAWKRLGYPFDSLVPSYATAIGSSADRPAALAELMGILVNDGKRLPTLRIDNLQFARDTPYETRLARAQSEGEQVMAPAVAAVARRAIAEVVEQGTAKRLRGAFKRPDGSPMDVGGKTGTGDHRYEVYGRGGQLISSRVVSRSGTFVFFVGERHFGTLTAYVRGPEAAKYSFTSALPVQILKALVPALNSFVNRPAAESACR
jgi:membrane peptidoglycan carboxypeptidase